MQCPQCRADNDADLSFCESCGAKLARLCPSCGHELKPQAKFCGKCGAATVGSRQTAVDSSDSDLTTNNPTPNNLSSGERRQLTVIFSDLVGSTALSAQFDPEEWREIVSRYHRATTEAVEKFGGHVAKNLGDGLLIYFGWPVAREDDPERAIRAGLAIVEAVHALNEGLLPNPPPLPDVATEEGTRISPASVVADETPIPSSANISVSGGGLGRRPLLSVRVGMHTGPVVIADGGEVFGETANIAARVQSAAEPDTVVITAATQRLVAGLFVVEDRGPQELKGVRELVTLYRVVQPSGVRSRLDVAAGRLTRFVGRDIELATLIDRWERAADGEGQNVVVLGEAGVGKSRLVYQLHEHLAAVPHTWLECGASQYTEGTPFHPVIALVSQGLAFAPEDTAAEKLAKLEIGLRALASAETVALLADFLGLPPPTRLQFSPELQRRKTIDLLAQWNLALSEVQPLVLFIEDLHWCDASTLELLGHLIAQSPTARVLLLATARPDFTPPWPARSNLTTVQLARLTKRQGREMIVRLVSLDTRPEKMAATRENGQEAGGHPSGSPSSDPAVGSRIEGLSDAVIDALVARADGVPLFVEELTKTLLESGTARNVNAIPSSLADSLMARLDRLATAKEIAQTASVLGREFSYGLLQALVGATHASPSVSDAADAGDVRARHASPLHEEDLQRSLRRLVDVEILFARGEPPAATYTFKHALIQETAYQSQLKRTRRQLHARVAQVLEERFPERVAAEPEVIARHYDQAGLVAQASAHYQRAGERATQRSAYEEAIAHLRRALDLVATLPETRERHRMELGLQMAIGAPLIAARGISHPENEQAYARARELASQVGELRELPRVFVGMADAYLVKGDLATAAEVAQDALAAAERTGDPFDLLSAHYQVAIPLFYQGHFSRALYHFEQSVGLYDPSAHGSLAYTMGIDRGVQAHAAASECHTYLGHLDRALALSEEAVALAQRVAHPVSLAQALFFAGLVHIERAELDRISERAEELVGLCERLGIPFYLGLGRWMRGYARIELGEGEAGIAEMQQGLVNLAEIGSGVGAPGILAKFAEGLRKVGRHDDALGAVGLGLAQAKQQAQHFFDADLHRLRAEILVDIDGNAAEEPEALFGQAVEIARQQEAKTFELRAATSLARLWQRQGRRAAARDLLAPVYEWFTEGFDTRDLKDAKALLEELGC
ncbi:MAG: AAA family ATPase [Deltaproteobacteria bacterium]|nr:AAA family ATPase [Deltaproteobacteria bacterium]MBI3389772.1 AAA family ATPase [Deltaproteobacteria bacterium]